MVGKYYKPDAKRLSPAELTAIVDIVKFWEPEKKKLMGKLMRHNAWLHEELKKAENQIQEYRQIKIDDSIKANEERPKQRFFTSTDVKDIRYGSKGHRFYDFLRTQPEHTHERFYKYNGVTRAEALALANDFAKETGKEPIHDRGTSSSDQDQSV